MLYKSILRTAWRYYTRNKIQTCLLLLGISLGVAVIVAIDLANVSVERAFLLSKEAVMGRATHQITATPGGVPDSVYTAIKNQAGIDKAAPVINRLVSAPELTDRPLQLLGIDPFAEEHFRDYLTPEGENKTWIRLLTIPGAVLIPESMVGNTPGHVCPELLNQETVCQIELDISGKQKTANIVGYWSFQRERLPAIGQKYTEDLLITDISTAQELYDFIGHLDRIDLILPESCNTEESSPSGRIPGCHEIGAISRLLPENAYLESAQANSDILNQMTAAFRLNLSALSLLALVVGMFLIYNTMTYSVIRRRSSLGILRCLGLTRKELLVQILGEAFIIGIAGTMAGLLLGIVLGQGSVGLVSQTINDLYFVTNIRGVQIPFISLVKGILIGITATLLAAILPAIEAAKIPPVTALQRISLEHKAKSAIKTASWIGVCLFVMGGWILVKTDRSLIWGFAGTLAIILGFALTTPSLTKYLMQILASPLRRSFGLMGSMAPLNVNNSLSRTGVAIAALSVAIAVTIGLNLMIDSFRHTVQIWLEETLQGDIYLSVPSLTSSLDASPIDEKVYMELEKIPEITRIDVLRSVEVRSNLGPIHVAASSNPDLAHERLYLKAIGNPDAVSQQLANGAVLISEPLANRLGISDLGDTIALLTSSGLEDFKLAGIYFDYSSSQGTLLMTLKTYRALWSDDLINAIALRVEDGADLGGIVELLKKRLINIQSLNIRPSQELRSEALAVFDRTFTIAIALRGLAFLVAFVGLFAASLAWQLDKSREVGILRAIGMTKGQIVRLVLAESGLIGISSGLASIPAGYLLALILTTIINRRSFGWTLQMQVDFTTFFQAVLLAIFATLLSGLYPARRMSNAQPAEILRSE